MTNFKEIFKEYNIELTDSNIEKINNYYNILIEENNKYNLTNIVDYEEFFIKHVLDSALPINLIEKNKNIVDIGCGAGFPSVIFSILREDLKILGIDSVNKKTNFINIVKEKLNLKNINAEHIRIEDYAKKYREKINIVTGRAVAPLNIFLEYSIPLIKKDGYVLIYKSQNVENEILNSQNAFKELNCYIDKKINYKIKYKDEFIERVVLIVKKNKKTDMKYPRDKNKPRLNPL